MKRPVDAAEAQQWLIKFGRELATWVELERQAGRSPDFAQWALGAVGEHLISGTDLGLALGLVRTGAGRPVDEENLEWALKAHPHVPKTGRANWFAIARAVGYRGNNLRRIYKEHFDEMKFALREVERGLSDDTQQ